MKNLVKLMTILNLTILSTQATTQFKRIIKDETHETTVELNKETVRCSALGYGQSELKISVPSLKWNAIFDHSNTDGRGPCVTAGRMSCSNFLQFPTLTEANLPSISETKSSIPDELIDPDKPKEKILVRVFLTEEFTITEDSCFRELRENVETNVRGINFNHLRIKNIGELEVNECLQIQSSL